MTKRDLCPTCKQALPNHPGQRRLCYACKAPIGKYDKWFFMTEGETTYVVHRHCDNPESYGPQAAKNINQTTLVKI